MLKEILGGIKKTWRFLWYGDSLLSYVAFFLFAIIALNLLYPLFFFGLSHTIGVNDVVAVVSGSMVHDKTINTTFYQYFDKVGLNESHRNSFPFLNGLYPGDLMIVWNADAEHITVGDVIVFDSLGVLIIHRVVAKTLQDGTWYFTTKGDHNVASMAAETNLTITDIRGVAKQRVPLLGVPKLILTSFAGVVNNVL